MRYRPLSRSMPEIQVSEVGFGCWSMGGPNFSPDDGQATGMSGPVDRDDILAGVRVGIEAGVTHWDNADVYGNGRAERLLRDCFADLGVQRSDHIIATKVGHFRGTAEHAYEPHHIRRQCEQSLRNLGTDYIDIYYFHHGWFGGRLEEAASTMHDLVREGKVRAIGQSAYSAEDFANSMPVVKPHVLQSWANMLSDEFIRPGSAVQALMEEHACGFVAFSPLAQGRLLDKFGGSGAPSFKQGDIRGRKPEFSPEALADLQPRLERLKNRFGEGAEALASAACRFVLAHDHVCSVIPGFTNAKQAACNVKAGEDEAFDTQTLDFCRAAFGEKRSD